ncbi:MAG: TAXI family TRAP transporter solute-binding subunit [Thermoanaerobaculia bacterium]|nr:TAXI family TRAP transporter solute-binding subunit [Thermoanaerobaculia bacterium]
METRSDHGKSDGVAREASFRNGAPGGRGPSEANGSAGPRELLRVWLPVVVLAVAAFGFTLTKLEPPAPDRLRLASGGVGGAYDTFAREYVSVLAAHDIELEIVPTAGAVENLRLLAAGDVDIAMLQGGVVLDADGSLRGSLDDLRSLGATFFEPVWLFYRADGEAGGGVVRLTDLAGRRVAVGPEGSGTDALARQLLTDNGLDLVTGADPAASASESWVEIVRLSSPDAADALTTGQVDAAIFVASASASYIRELLAYPGVELMSFRRHRAYSHRHPYLSQVVLGEGMLDLEANLPAQDIALLASAASLAVREEFHHALVPLMVQAMEEIHGRGGLFEEPDSFPTSRFAELRLNNEAEHYLENGPSFLYRVLPYRTAASVDRLKILLLPFVPLLLVAFKMAPPIYRWRIRSKIYRWYEDLRRIDLFLLDSDQGNGVDEHLELVRRMERELTEEVSVPLSYMDEFYDLRVHVRLIQQKLEDLKAGAPRAI